MARGDWAPGTKAVDRIAQIVIDDEGRVTHCGLGGRLVARSGRTLTSTWGHTWGGPDQQPPAPWLARLQEAMDELVREAYETEGLDVPA